MSAIHIASDINNTNLKTTIFMQKSEHVCTNKIITDSHKIEKLDCIIKQNSS